MNKVIDYLIIGAGPAGLQLGYYLEKNKHDYLIVEKGTSPGTFFKKNPRHGKLISNNKVYTGYNDPEINLRWDWNSLLTDDYKLKFKKYSKEYFPNPKYLVEYLNDFAKTYHLKIRCRTEVKKISKSDIFTVTLANGKKIKAKRVIVASGMCKPYLPPIPGIEHVDDYSDMSINKKNYVNKRVLVIGKGNSGFETADHLIDVTSLIHIVSPNPLKMAWRSHHVGHLRAVNNNLLDTYQFKSQNAIINAEIVKIIYKNNTYKVHFAYANAHDEHEMIEYDHVITCTGFTIDDSIFSKTCRPELTRHNRLPAITSWYESQNVEDLYFAGVLMQDRDYKKKQTSVIHGFRYNVKFLADFFEHKYHHRQFYKSIVKPTPRALMRAVIEKVNRSSAMWQQNAYICDLLVFNKEDSNFYYYDCVPYDFMKDSNFGGRGHYFTVTLEFGQDIIDKACNLFELERVHKNDYKNANKSAFIHPIIRHFYNHKLVSEHHVIEDFASEWLETVHTKPLAAYFKKALPKILKTVVSS